MKTRFAFLLLAASAFTLGFACEKESNPKIEKEIFDLRPEIEGIDLANFVAITCGHDADCITKNSSHFDTAEKRTFLNNRTIQGLIIAKEKGLSIEKIKSAVKEAKIVSKKTELTAATYRDFASKNAIDLLICMTTDTSTPTPSGLLKDPNCFINNAEK